MYRLRILLCVVGLAACSAQTFEQDGGDLKRTEVEYISARMRDATEQEYPLLKHKLVTRYVDALGQSIVSRNRAMPPLPYEFRTLRANEVLALSLPGGVLYVSLGLLRTVELEGQLAAAIAHELAHQQLNHPLITWRRKVNSTRGQRYIADFSGDWKDEFLGPRGALFFEKAMEEEADRLAPVILYNAGFDPRVYISYLQLLQKRSTADAVSVAAVVSLHPAFAERLKWANEAILRLPPKKDPSLSSPSFTQIKGILREAAAAAGKGAKPAQGAKSAPKSKEQKK